MGRQWRWSLKDMDRQWQWRWSLKDTCRRECGPSRSWVDSEGGPSRTWVDSEGGPSRTCVERKGNPSKAWVLCGSIFSTPLHCWWQLGMPLDYDLVYFLSCHIHTLTTPYTLTLPWSRTEWLYCDQLWYKFLHFSRFSPSLQYVKLKTALNMEALLKTLLHRLNVPDIPKLQTQCSTHTIQTA